MNKWPEKENYVHVYFSLTLVYGGWRMWMLLMSHCPLSSQVPKVLVSEQTCAWLSLQITWASVGQVRKILQCSFSLSLNPIYLTFLSLYCHLQANIISYNAVIMKPWTGGAEDHLIKTKIIKLSPCYRISALKCKCSNETTYKLFYQS